MKRMTSIAKCAARTAQLGAILVGVGTVLIAASQPAAAKIITVTSTSGGTGGPSCTLRDAITAANTDGATGGCQGGTGTDTLVLPNAAPITLTVADNATDGGNGLPVITTTIIINGNGSTIARSSAGGTPVFRIFDVAGSGDLALNNLTITNGLTSDGSKGGPGGGLRNGGTLTLNNCTVSGNTTGNGSDDSDGGDGGDGGGIFNEGTLTMTNCTVSGNTTGDGGEGDDGDGGDGGDGGGIANEGTASLTNCTISGNTTGDGGDGSFEGGDGGDGGGIVTDGDLVALANCTITRNTAGSRGIGEENDGDDGNGGGVAEEGNLTTLKNTILGLNTIGSFGDGPECSGTLTSQGYNLVQHTLGCTFVPTTGDITLQLPKLEPLTNNGGPTETHALMSDSMAVDRGNPAGCTDTDGNLLTTDQRGAPRPVDGGSGFGNRCDIGAYEFGSLLPNGVQCTADQQCASGRCAGVCISGLQAPALSLGMLLLLGVLLSAWGAWHVRPVVRRR